MMSRSITVPLIASLGACALVLSVACGDHDELAQDPPVESTSSAGGAGGSLVSSSSVGGSGGVGGIEEPAGPTKLTIVNGVADHSAIRMCFVPYPDGASGELPWPGVQGLPFAQPAVVDIAADIPSNSDVEVVAFAGTLSATGGQSCADLISSPPSGVELARLGVVPQAVFSEEKSLLFVPSGCMGGAGHGGDDEELACGLGYSESTPNATLLAGFMSRIFSSGKLNMQFVHASWGVGMQSIVRVVPAGNGPAQLVVPDWTVGAIAPFPPYDFLSTADLVSVDQSMFALYEQSTPDPIYATQLSTAFGNSTLTSGDAVDGSGVVFLGVGASPHAPTNGWWNDYTITVVASDP